jgi:hypothetical protein
MIELVKKSGSYYRAIKAASENRLIGVNGRPPLIRADHLDILWSRIRLLVLQKIQVTNEVLAELVSIFMCLYFINFRLKK